MKFILLLLCIIITGNDLFGQLSKTVTISSRIFLSDGAGNSISVPKETGIEGNQFVFNEWLLAKIFFSNNTYADSVPVKLNAYTGKIHYRNVKGGEMELIGPVSEVTIVDSNTAWHQAIFKNGFDEEPATFFLVLMELNNMQLLKKTVVEKWELNSATQPSQKGYSKKEELYFSVDKQLYRQRKNCESLNAAFGNDKQVLRYIADNKLSCNSEAELRRLLLYINTR